MVLKMAKQFNRLTVKVYAWFAKPLNGSSGKSKGSFLMKGGEIPYKFKGIINVSIGKLEKFIELNRNDILDNIEDLRLRAESKHPDTKIAVTILKDDIGISRVVKGMRGALRHNIMNILHQKDISYCIPTSKERFQKSEELTYLNGEHLMGKCGENPCPIRQLFGILGEESPIKIWSDVIVQAKDKVAITNILPQKGLAFVHTSTEIRHASRRDKKTLQDFTEQYFSGEFQFYIEYTKDLPKWLIGLLVEGIFNLTNIGRGSNSGYGRLSIKEMTFEQVSLERTFGKESNGRMAILEEESTINKNDFLKECLEIWHNN